MDISTSKMLGVTSIVGSLVFGHLARSARDEASHASTDLARKDQLSKAEFMEYASGFGLGVALGIVFVNVSKSKQT